MKQPFRITGYFLLASLLLIGSWMFVSGTGRTAAVEQDAMTGQGSGSKEDSDTKKLSAGMDAANKNAGSSSASESTADHGKFEVLQQDFATGPDVTKACLTCHTEAAKQIMKTIHWTWLCPKMGKDKIGKLNVINNYCTAIASNEPRCTSCHAGYGWKDKNFDFSSETNVDCLVCHDTTGTYKKFPTAAGHPAYEEKTFSGKKFTPPDLAKIGRNVGKSSRQTCGACHFFGGGADGVKHGDLDSSLLNADKSLDVHMDAKGLNFGCAKCHTTKAHDIAGRCYSVPAEGKREFALPEDDGNRITCESCHGSAPHKNKPKLDDHTDKVACQTCHIPTYARVKPTKMWWDWSQAGKFDENGGMLVKKDENGNVIYHTKKGAFRWEKNVIPEYYWFNEVTSNTLLTDKFDDTKPVQINTLHGSYDTPNSRIWPVKVHRGKQVYDAGNKTLVVPKLFGPKGSGAYWAEFDWGKSIKAGMDYVGVPYSGKYGAVETEMYWPLAHMIAPKEDSLSCGECHSKNGRLQTLSGFYMPGKDCCKALDIIGWLAILAAFIGVIVHGLLRIISRRKGGSMS